MFIVTSIAAGRVGDIIGRRGTLFIGGVVFTVGGIVQTFTSGYWVMVLGRVVSGFGVGLLSWVYQIRYCMMKRINAHDSTIVPIYQSEISPPNHACVSPCHITPFDSRCFQRGALACAEFTGNIFGYAFSVVGIPASHDRSTFWYIPQWTDYFCSFINSNLAWRVPLFIQCVIGAILAAGSLLMPESPRWVLARPASYPMIDSVNCFT